MFWNKRKAPKNQEANQPVNGENSILKQDLSEKAKYSGVYVMRLLFKEKVSRPASPALTDRLKARFGGIDVVSDTSGLVSFALTDHLVTYKDDKKVPSQLMLVECNPVQEPIGDAINRTQFWDCPDGVELLDSCPWQVMTSDFMAGGLPPLERADILADWLEILLDLFPQCAAVYFDASGKLMPADSMRENPYTGPLRFFQGGVNARFFNIQGSNDMLVDTLGLYALVLPDVQYHFRDLNPNDVVRHAYNTAIYQFENGAPIESGHTIGGIEPDSKWKCQYEDSLIQPSRVVLDIAAGEFASGRRNGEI